MATKPDESCAEQFYSNLMNQNQSVESIVIPIHYFVTLIIKQQIQAAATMVVKTRLPVQLRNYRNFFTPSCHLLETSYSSVWQADAPGLP